MGIPRIDRGASPSGTLLPFHSHVDNLRMSLKAPRGDGRLLRENRARERRPDAGALGDRGAGYDYAPQVLSGKGVEDKMEG